MKPKKKRKYIDWHFFDIRFGLNKFIRVRFSGLSDKQMEEITVEFLPTESGRKTYGITIPN